MGAPRLLVHGGPIITLDPVQPAPEAMLVADGHVLALGTRADLAGAWGDHVQALDLAGRAVIPGLTDSHLHLLSYGLVLEQVALGGVDSIAGLVAAVAAGARATAVDGGWVLGRGWDQDQLAEHRYPNRQDLDLAAPGRPVLLVRSCGHCTVVSSRALELAGITSATADPPGGRIERDPATGEPTGILHESAAALVRAVVPAPSYAAKRRGLAKAFRLALSAGLTACHPDDVRNAGDFATAWRLYEDVLAATGGPRIRAEVSDFAIDELLATGMRTGSGNRMLSVGAIKSFVDGSLGARSAALTAPYDDGPGAGILVRERGEFMRTIAKAHRAGMQVAIHAIGDLAVDWALDGIEAAQAGRPALALRHRVVHAQITRPDQLPRFVALGAVAEIQPKFVTTDKLWVESRIGAGRAAHSYCWKTMLQAGVPLAGGSDGPVEPLHPLYGIFAAVTRQGMDGTPAEGWLPGERLSVGEALRLFAEGGAYAAFEEGWRGTLTPGKAADFVVLDRSPFAVEPGELKDLAVEMTYVGGRKGLSGTLIRPALLAIYVGIAAADRVTKLQILRTLAPGASVRICPFLSATLVFNRGAAFGLGAEIAPLLVLLRAIIACGVFLAARRLAWLGKPGAVALGLLGGGSLGNLVDHLLYGHVVDFIDLGWFPVFNIADCGIVAGGILLAITVLRAESRLRSPAGGAGRTEP